MHRIFLSLGVAALASFATAVHADDLLRPSHGQIIVAELHGKGEVGKACHATGGNLKINQGKYDYDNKELVCKGVMNAKVFCHPEQRPSSYDSNHTHCWDGNDT
jgi:hypothetical protein